MIQKVRGEYIISKEEPEIFGFAFDHRKQLSDLAVKYGEDLSQITKLKKLFIEYEANDDLIKKIISIGPDISYQIESLKN